MVARTVCGTGSSTVGWPAWRTASRTTWYCWRTVPWGREHVAGDRAALQPHSQCAAHARAQQPQVERIALGVEQVPLREPELVQIGRHAHVAGPLKHGGGSEAVGSALGNNPIGRGVHKGLLGPVPGIGANEAPAIPQVCWQEPANPTRDIVPSHAIPKAPALVE